jgi:hypothetical protein
MSLFMRAVSFVMVPFADLADMAIPALGSLEIAHVVIPVAAGITTSPLRLKDCFLFRASVGFQTNSSDMEVLSFEVPELVEIQEFCVLDGSNIFADGFVKLEDF